MFRGGVARLLCWGARLVKGFWRAEEDGTNRWGVISAGESEERRCFGATWGWEYNNRRCGNKAVDFVFARGLGFAVRVFFRRKMRGA